MRDEKCGRFSTYNIVAEALGLGNRTSALGWGAAVPPPPGGGGPCEAWWRGTRGVSCPLYVTRLRPCPPPTFGGPPPPSGEDRPLPVVSGLTPRAISARGPAPYLVRTNTPS